MLKGYFDDSEYRRSGRHRLTVVCWYQLRFLPVRVRLLPQWGKSRIAEVLQRCILNSEIRAVLLTFTAGKSAMTHLTFKLSGFVARKGKLA